MGLEDKYPYFYDLADAWKELTGLPFVFAVWVSNKKLPKEFIIKFNYALNKGVEEIPNLKFLLPKLDSGFDLDAYFTKYISYELDDLKKQALQIFLEYLNTGKLVLNKKTTYSKFLSH